MKPFLIIKTGGTFPEYAQDNGDFEDWTAQGMGLGAGEWQSVHVQGGESLPDPDDFAGCAITGSHDMVTEDLAWIHDTGRWLLDAAERGLPLFGICFGHQLLAASLGGEAGFHPVSPEIGTFAITKTEAASSDPLFSKLPKTFDGHATHYQCALALPSEAVLLAATPHEPHQAFRFGKHIWGVQFHPEFDADAERNYVAMQRDVIAKFGGDTDALHADVRETPESASLLKAFADYCRSL